MSIIQTGVGHYHYHYHTSTTIITATTTTSNTMNNTNSSIGTMGKIESREVLVLSRRAEAAKVSVGMRRNHMISGPKRSVTAPVH